MDNSIYRISFYLQKYLDGDIQEEELSLLYHLLEASTADEIQAAFDIIWNKASTQNDHTPPLFSAEETAALLRDIMAQTPVPKRKKVRWKKTTVYASAACLVGALLMLMWLRPDRKVVPTETELSVAAQRIEHDVDPAGDKATLSLEGGEKFSLQDIKVGSSVQMGNVKLVNVNGQLSYEPVSREAPATQHVIQTPKGGQINMTLPDGTKVWLNADSRITFLSNIGAGHREVTVTGEVYFDVANLDGKRFTVKNSSGEIEVLGTKFNVRAYPEDKAMQAALVEGSLELKNKTDRAILKPHQVGVVSATQRISVTKHAHITDIIAWKNGLFLFKNTPLTEVGRQLGRWYNINVQLGEGLATKRITGKITRDVKLSQVLSMLDYLGIETKVKDNNLMMTSPKEHAYEQTPKM